MVTLSQKELLVFYIMQLVKQICRKMEVTIMAVINLTKENFEKEVAEGTVLVDFWAPWCMPCRMLSPIVDGVSEEVTNVKVAKVNVDEQESLAARFDVMSIPTLIVLKDGKEVKRSVGVVPKEAIVNMLG